LGYQSLPILMTARGLPKKQLPGDSQNQSFTHLTNFT
jgi:hypothetical protein